MEYKLLALDLDGTLLNGDEKISERNLTTLERASRKGIKIIVNTGRSYSSTKDYMDIINIKDPVITYNGAVIYNGNHILRKITLRDYVIEDLIKILKDMEFAPILYLPDNRRYYENLGKYTEDFLKFSRGFEQELVQVRDIEKKAWKNVIRISVLAGKRDILPLHSQLRNKFGSSIKTIDTYFADWNFWIFEILDGECSKSKGLDFLCNIYGIGKEEVIAIGDNNNDLDMISWAGLGVAMKNSLPSLLKEADYITEKDNNEDGVSEVIEKFILTDKIL